jgi:hypothetical protein
MGRRMADLNIEGAVRLHSWVLRCQSMCVWWWGGVWGAVHRLEGVETNSIDNRLHPEGSSSLLAARVRNVHSPSQQRTPFC